MLNVTNFVNNFEASVVKDKSPTLKSDYNITWVLAGVLLAESKYRQTIEREVGPIRGILVGLFFFTVGFEIDLGLIASKFPLVASLVAAITFGKFAIAGNVARYFGVPTPTARHLGLVLSQGGEFAFVAFRMARSYRILSDDVTKLMLTVVSLTMALTPFLEELGAKMAVPTLKLKKGRKGKKGKSH